jgi:hypothetical protein
VNVYLAGPLFSEAERAWLDALAARIRAQGARCFVPHEAAAGLGRPWPAAVLALDAEGLLAAHAMVAWLDGPAVDDGTACEIGMFYGLMRSGQTWRKGILGLVTDLRLSRRRESVPAAGLNLFVAGVVETAGRLCWSVEEVLAELGAWQADL